MSGVTSVLRNALKTGVLGRVVVTKMLEDMTISVAVAILADN